MDISKIYIAGDHAAYSAKEETKNFLLKKGYKVIDLGTNSPDISVDYPDFAKKLCEKMINDKKAYGILICGTGLGISMAANRYKYIRCALCHDAFTAKMAREHNDANVLAFGARVVGTGIIQNMCEVFFNTEFAGARHQRRIDKLG